MTEYQTLLDDMTLYQLLEMALVFIPEDEALAALSEDDGTERLKGLLVQGTEPELAEREEYGREMLENMAAMKAASPYTVILPKSE